MSQDLRDRTKRLSLSIIDLVEKMDYSMTKKIIMNQLIKCGTSVGANYRASNRARSDQEFRAKINIVLEEVDESCYWLEIIKEKGRSNVESELKEANELTAICVSILKKINDKLDEKKRKSNSKMLYILN